MDIASQLQARSQNQCELCSGTEGLSVYTVPDALSEEQATAIYVCSICLDQISEATPLDTNHWRCLNDSMWSTVPAVQVMAFRLLFALKNEGWPQDLLDMMYMEPDTRAWAEARLTREEEVQITHRDVNGNELTAGDSVVLIKDLKVKGSSMVAKQGTAVRRISLDPENENYIEGKVDGQHIVLVTDYIKKM
ncbi:PhnA domain-containing protein [Altibacter sp. HG106]|uniref:PhnA domain-containing protein n=1 Tax=Altibacter sp. HG106 TaxID=3023937 RepID=UPI0023503A87|nr:alkylphosphonate utilization protein [Altibacter sp. HG106]MDC7994086.1 PhnA domain-containing protein [Altibacter sp. HG106]